VGGHDFLLLLAASVPELAKLPTKYIYEPWTAPLDVQQR
jgi:hypothetical protein